MHKQTLAFERLWRWTKEARKVYRSRSAASGSQLHVPLLDIKPEGELEREIKDIVEELGIMIHIHKTQRYIFRQFVSNAEHILDPAGAHSEKYYTDKMKGKAVRQTAISRRTSRIGLSPLNTPAEQGGATVPGKESSYMDPRPLILDGMSASPKFRPVADGAKTRSEEAYDCFKLNAHDMLGRINDRVGQLQELAKNAEAVAASVSTGLVQGHQNQQGHATDEIS